MKKPTLSSIISLYNPLITKIYVFLRQIEFPLDALDRYLPKKGRIIDLGCGVGCTDIYLALKEKELRILGIELDAGRVRVARKASERIENLRFETGDITRQEVLPACDVILLVDVLHHIPRKAHYPLIDKCYASLPKGGMLIVKDIDTRPRWKFWYNYLQDKVMTLNGRLNFITPMDMVGLLARAGFMVETHKLKTWDLNPIPHRIYICRK